jgi:voltage-gated potassium channel
VTQQSTSSPVSEAGPDAGLDAGQREVEARVDRWEALAFWPLTAVSVLFLGAYAWPILQPDLDPTLRHACAVTTWITWAVFAVDYFGRLALSPRRGVFVRANLLDLAVVVLPVLRPLRLLQLIRVLSVLNRTAGSSLRGRVAVYVAGSTGLVLLVASLAVLDVERDAEGATITGFGDALWWSFTTVTTVGYGDRFPVTGTGRMVAIGLMLAGIALLGVVTASLASWLLDRVAEVEEESQAATRKDVRRLTEEVTALREEMARLRGAPDRGD